MYPSVYSSLAVVGRPLFGNQWLALLAILAGISVFLVAVALVGRWLAATHPVTPTVARNKAPIVEEEEEAPLAVAVPTAELMVVISAAVSATFGNKAQIVGVSTLHPPSVETLMQQWSFEGRRQIYSSHKVR